MTSIRPATSADVREIMRLIHDLAEYERSADQVRMDEDSLRRGLFGEDPAASALVAQVEEGGGPRVVGVAVWFRTFSTWTGTNIWLEDLYVDPARRGSGLGTALLSALAGICVERGYARLEWTVLDWNTPAVDFYRSLGAVGQDEWTTQRVDGEALTALAGAGSAADLPA